MANNSLFNNVDLDGFVFNTSDLDEAYMNGVLVFSAVTNILVVGTDGTFGFLGYDVNGPYGSFTPTTWTTETIDGFISTSAGFLSILLNGNNRGATVFSEVKMKGSFAGGSNPRSISLVTSGGNFTYNPTAGPSQSSYSWDSLPANDRVVLGNTYDITFKP